MGLQCDFKICEDRVLEDIYVRVEYSKNKSGESLIIAYGIFSDRESCAKGKGGMLAKKQFLLIPADDLDYLNFNYDLPEDKKDLDRIKAYYLLKKKVFPDAIDVIE